MSGALPGLGGLHVALSTGKDAGSGVDSSRVARGFVRGCLLIISFVVFMCSFFICLEGHKRGVVSGGSQPDRKRYAGYTLHQ